ncbi:MAG: DEAD/DEAH box helicase [Clostridiales bacterium]|nr:DEAD/DEAH box helicase [Clostridiales bacterium]
MDSLIFKDLNLSEEVQKAIADMGFEEATPIQSRAIPPIMEGQDVIGQAQTGTGKTCAFGIPAIEMADPDKNDVQALILCPTRELAIQISEELKGVSKYKTGIRILPVYGGQPIDRQIMALKKKPQIIIGTPGRIMDHMRRNTLKFGNLKMIVLDEADEMLNMGFREDIDIILEKIPEERQTILFSATMSREIMDLTSKYQKAPVNIKIAHKELTVPSIEQYYLEVTENAKPEILSRLIDANNIKLSLVFCNTKKKVDELAMHMQSRGYAAEALHGDMRQEQRNKVMTRFKKGNIDILIATDVAARGIDVNDIEAVFNYDIPNDEEYYVHRIGRTGRAGKTGKSFTLAVGREIYKLKDIQRYTKSSMTRIKPPSATDIEERKVGNMIDDLKKILDEKKHTKYVAYVEKALEDLNSETPEDEDGFNSIDFAAALIQLQFSKSGGNTDEGLDKAIGASASTSDDEDFETADGMVRLFINVGRKNQIQPKHIVQSIASGSGLPGKLIGAINIFDDYTFVEVPREDAANVLESMKNYNIKGKKINIEKTNKKPEGRPVPKKSQSYGTPPRSSRSSSGGSKTPYGSSRDGSSRDGSSREGSSREGSSRDGYSKDSSKDSSKDGTKEYLKEYSKEHSKRKKS